MATLDLKKISSISLSALLFIGSLSPIYGQQLALVKNTVNDPTKTSSAIVTAEAKADPVKKTVDPAEMLRLITALEDRIHLLEEKLVATSKTPVNAAVATTALPVPVVQDDLKKEVTTLKEEVKKQEGMLGFLRDVEVSGIVDGYYSYNNNKCGNFLYSWSTSCWYKSDYNK